MGPLFCVPETCFTKGRWSTALDFKFCLFVSLHCSALFCFCFVPALLYSCINCGYYFFCMIFVISRKYHFLFLFVCLFVCEVFLTMQNKQMFTQCVFFSSLHSMGARSKMASYLISQIYIYTSD